MKWKSSRHLPPYRKLSITFDLMKLREDYLALAARSDFGGYLDDYAELCATYGARKGTDELRPELKDQDYQNLALTVFDSDFSIDQRAEKSGSHWDERIPFENPRLDERFYRRRIEGIPPYLASVLDYFHPHGHRARFAKLRAGTRISPHVDYDAKYSIRVAIPLLSNERCLNFFKVPGQGVIETHFPADGSCYFINSGIPHWAENRSEQDRVFLILSVDSQKYLAPTLGPEMSSPQVSVGEIMEER